MHTKEAIYLYNFIISICKPQWAMRWSFDFLPRNFLDLVSNGIMVRRCTKTDRIKKFQYLFALYLGKWHLQINKGSTLPLSPFWHRSLHGWQKVENKGKKGVHSNVFIYLFEHFVFLLDGIYRNQHWYTCWYIFADFRHTKVNVDCNVKYITKPNQFETNVSHAGFIFFGVPKHTHSKWKHITVGWPIHVCHASKLFKCV